MKRAQGLKRITTVLVLATGITATTASIAHANYSQAPPLDFGKNDKVASKNVQQAVQQQAGTTNPFNSVRKISLTGKSIVVTYDAPERKGGKRNMVIDYSGIAPGLTSAKGSAGKALGGGSVMQYGIMALLGWTVLGRVRRMLRRVVRA